MQLILQCVALEQPIHGGSRNTLALRRLARQQKGLDQFTLATDRHGREPFVPKTLRHFGLAVKPLRQLFQLRCWNLPAVNAVEQMLKKRGWNIVAADARQNRIPGRPGLDSVEAAGETLFDARRLRRIRRRRELFPK